MDKDQDRDKYKGEQPQNLSANQPHRGDSLDLPVADPRQQRVQRLERLAWLLDRSVKLPGGVRIGLDGIVGLIPVIGDLSTLAVSAYIINEARQLGVPTTTLLRMLVNVGVDTAIGSIPIIGDLFDFYLKANVKNIQLLMKHIDQSNLR